MSSTTASAFDQESTPFYFNLLDMSFDNTELPLPCELLIHWESSMIQTSDFYKRRDSTDTLPNEMVQNSPKDQFVGLFGM